MAARRAQQRRLLSLVEICISQKLFERFAMGLLLWIVFGIIAGSVARLLMPGPDRLGIVGTMLVGVAGAVVGGFIGALSGAGGLIGFDVRSLLMAIIGSLAVLFCYRTFSMRAMA
jgi:uncharacterized membrane protein YeaQ/YmgE (transglycosylase-associated protein family)